MNWPYLLQLLALCTLYGSGAALVGYGQYVNLARRRHGARFEDDDWLGCLVSGLFWPAGLWWVLVGLMIHRREASEASGGVASKAQRAREKELLRAREDLRLDIMEQENRLAQLEFERRRTREIEDG